jgi:phosphoribosylamine--glycine ligase
MPRIKSDLVELLVACGEGTLEGKHLEVHNDFAVTVALVSGGYPGEYETGKVIRGLELQGESIVFHAGTTRQHNDVLTHGGRVLAISGKGHSLEQARARAYQTASGINWEGLYYRKDIGQDLMNYKG